MTLSTTDKPEDKRERRKKLREFHQATLDSIGPDVKFMPKMAYRPYGKTELHIAFFESEINHGDDVYVEFCSKDDVPEDPERKLYKYRSNPHFQEEYEKTEPNPTTGHCRYLVPVGELTLIKTYKESEEKKEEETFELSDPETDLPMDQMTIRDYVAIHTGRPVSRKPWLNEIIKSK